MTFLPAEFYRQVEESMPIACVDFIPMRDTPSGPEVGLILRDSPYGRVWCHLGGRIRRGETIIQALQRHSRETLGIETDAAPNAQPVYVYEWFPAGLAPTDGTDVGSDERKHSIGLSFVVGLTGEPVAAGEATEFAWYPKAAIVELEMWPGSARLLRHCLRG